MGGGRAGAALSQPYGCTGREYDAESGLYHYRARSYDPAIGMFVQSDPARFSSGTLNLFEYVDGNPFMGDDPSGLFVNTAEYRNLVNVARANVLPTTTVASGALNLAAKIRAAMALGTLAITNGDTRNDDDERCIPLYLAIAKDVTTLRSRFEHFSLDPIGLPEFGKNSRAGHVQAFQQRQTVLRGKIRSSESQGCFNYHPSANYWASISLPWLGE